MSADLRTHSLTRGQIEAGLRRLGQKAFAAGYPNKLITPKVSFGLQELFGPTNTAEQADAPSPQPAGSRPIGPCGHGPR